MNSNHVPLAFLLTFVVLTVLGLNYASLSPTAQAVTKEPPNQTESTNLQERTIPTQDLNNTVLASTTPGAPFTYLYPRSILPDKVFITIGLESSGTTFLSETIRNALGLRWIGAKDKYESIGEGFSDRYHGVEEGTKYWTEVQHVSLPWGGADCRKDPRQNVVDVVYPAICTKLMRDRMRMLSASYKPDMYADGPFVPTFMSDQIFRTYKIPQELRNRTLAECSSNTDYWVYPQRYSLNLSSHLAWYHSKGVDAKAIIIMRDATISRRARQGHCTNSTVLAREEELGREILQEAIHKHMIPKPRERRRLVQSSADGKVVLLSYELLNQLKGDYLDILYNELGINSESTFRKPLFRDGNVKHIRDEPLKKKAPSTSYGTIYRTRGG